MTTVYVIQHAEKQRGSNDAVAPDRVENGIPSCAIEGLDGVWTIRNIASSIM